jgi:hypothetical protein
MRRAFSVTVRTVELPTDQRCARKFGTTLSEHAYNRWRGRGGGGGKGSIRSWRVNKQDPNSCRREEYDLSVDHLHKWTLRGAEE